MKIDVARRAQAVLGIGMLLCGVPVWAGRPFATEDAGVIADGKCEIESSLAATRARPAPTEVSAWGQIGCGIGAATQLAAGLGRTRSGRDDQTIAVLGGKTALRPLSDEAPGLALAYELGTNKQADQGMRLDASSLSLVLTAPAGRTLLHANLGAVRSYVDETTWITYGLAWERLGEHGLDFGAEVYGQDGQRPWIGLGARYAVLPEKLSIDIYVAAQADGSHTRRVAVGLSYGFK